MFLLSFFGGLGDFDLQHMQTTSDITVGENTELNSKSFTAVKLLDYPNEC